MQRGRPKQTIKKVTLSTTIDPALAKKLSKLSKMNHRSIAGQISKILEDWISREETNGTVEGK